MATRFYLSATAAVYTPTTFRGTWGTTASAANGSLELGPIGTASTKAVAKTIATNPYDSCMLRLVSQPAVAAATITGTLQLIMGAVESNAAANDVFKIHAFVTTGASDTVRGTLLSNSVSGAFGTTAAGVDTGAQAVTSTAVQPGDRLVIEIGYRSSTANTTYTATVNLGNQGTTDLTSGSTSVTTLPGWVELSGADGIFATGAQLLADNFDDNSRNIGLWDYSYGTVTETGGRAQIACLAGVFSAYGSLPQYYLAGSLVAAQIVTLPAGGGSSAAYAYMGCLSNIAGTALSWAYDPLSGNLSAQSQVAYTDATPTTLTYNATNHAWWRIRESAGTVSWDTSLDGLTWTTQRTLATPAWVTRCQYGQVLFEANRTGGSTSGTFEVDNLNTVLGMPAGQAAATGTANAATASLGAAAGQPAGTGTAYDAVASVLPKVATLTDSFNTKDTAKWTFNGTSDVVSGQVTSVPTSGYANSVTSTANYDLANSAMSVELVNAPTGNGSIGVFFNYYESVSGDVVGFYVEGGALNFREIVGGSPSITSITYSSTSHRWLRLTHDGTNLLWETSPDRSTWTTQRTKTPGRTWTVGAVQVNTGFYGTEPTPGTALFDNINFSPSTPVSANADVSAAAGAAADAAGAVGAAAGVATAAGTADSPTSSVAAAAGAAAASGAASNGRVAHTYYVDPGGSDGSDGYSTGTAWATIGKVNAATLGAGDVVLFKRGGTWTGTGLTIAGSGQAGSPITISAYGSGALPIIDGGGNGVTPGTVDCITVTGSWVTVEYVEVRYASQYGILASGNDIELRSFTTRGNPFGVQQNAGAARTLIHDFVAVDNNIGIIGVGPDDDTGGMGVVLQGNLAEVYNFLISGSAFTSPDYGIDGSGVEIYGATNALIRDGLVHDCISFTEVGGTGANNISYRNIEYSTSLATALAVYLQGTGSFGPVTNVSITNCTLRMTGASSQGIGVGANATLALKNCVIESAYFGFWAGPQDEEHNLWFGGGSGSDVKSTHHATQSGLAPTSVVGDPLYVDAAGGNLRLGNNSPAINLGVAVAWSTDLDGSPRTVGADPDAGAYEWQGPLAGLASGVGTAPAGTASIGANAAATAATGTAGDATAALDAAAGQAAGSGTSYDAGASVAAGAGQPTGAGAGNDGSVSVTADSGTATAAGTADAGTAALTATPAEGAASGAALDASASVTASADISSATGTAYDAAVTAASSPSADVAPASGSAADATTSTAAQAGVATGTGVAHDAAASTTAAADQPTAAGAAYEATVTTAVAADAGAATASGISNDATADITATAGAAAGTGTADATTASLAAFADIATATGTAADATVTADATAGLATATGAAFDATANTSSSTSAPADPATAVGTALDASATIPVDAGVATAAGSGFDAAGGAGPNGGSAAAGGTADDASVTVTAAADIATAAAAAYDPAAAAQPGADGAAAAGAAHDTSTAVTANADVAQAAGTANDATATTAGSVNAPADVADATGSAYDATVAVGIAANPATSAATADTAAAWAAVDAALASGTAAGWDGAALIGAAPFPADASGLAYDPATAQTANADAATAAGQAPTAGAVGPIVTVRPGRLTVRTRPAGHLAVHTVAT